MHFSPELKASTQRYQDLIQEAKQYRLIKTATKAHSAFERAQTQAWFSQLWSKLTGKSTQQAAARSSTSGSAMPALPIP